MSTSPADQLPIAKVEQVSSKRFFLQSRYWVWTLVALVISGAFFVSHFLSKGHLVTISFREAHGLKSGDLVRYRGVDVGEVIDVRFDSKSERVITQVEFKQQYASLAVKGTEFWIERPQVSLARVRGLETVVGAKYISLIPGPDGSPRGTVFEGLELPRNHSESGYSEISIRFQRAEGLTIGDPIKFRDLNVGEVTSINLVEDLSEVEVVAILSPIGSNLAREGSIFWIEKPTIGFDKVSGIDTVLSGRFIHVIPGPASSKAATVFRGREQNPDQDEPASDGIVISLWTPDATGVKTGVPILFRGIRIGKVISVNVPEDGRTIESLAEIDSQHAHLIRNNSRFWKSGGMDVDVGLTGVELNFETLSTLFAGGINVATPDPPGTPIATGTRFELLLEADETVAAASPNLTLNGSVRQTSVMRSPPPPATITWKETTLGFKFTKRKTGNLLLLDDGSLLGLTEFLTASEDAVADTTRLEMFGEEFSVQLSTPPSSLLATIMLGTEFQQKAMKQNGVRLWSKSKLGPLSESTSLVLLQPSGGFHICMPESFSIVDGEALIDKPDQGSNALNGWPAFDFQNETLVGLQCFKENRLWVYPVTPIKDSPAPPTPASNSK